NPSRSRPCSSHSSRTVWTPARNSTSHAFAASPAGVPNFTGCFDVPRRARAYAAKSLAAASRSAGSWNTSSASTDSIRTFSRGFSSFTGSPPTTGDRASVNVPRSHDAADDDVLVGDEGADEEPVDGASPPGAAGACGGGAGGGPCDRPAVAHGFAAKATRATI